MLNNFKLQLKAFPKWKVTEILNLKRKLRTIEISDVTDCHSGCYEALARIFKKFGPHFRELHIANSEIDDFTFREMLKQAGMLETLNLREVSIIKKLPAINSVSMRTLKNLTVTHSDWNIIKFINAQVSSFQVKSYLDEGSSKSSLISFLAQQRQLKKLALCGTSSRTLFQQEDIALNCMFELQELQLDHDFGKHSDNVNRNIIAFMSLHVATLRKAEISGPYCDIINCFAISNLENLFSLTIDARGLPKDDEFYQFMECEPNVKLRALKLYGFFLHPEMNKKLLMKYPAIEKLELNEWGNGTSAVGLLQFVAANCPQLKELLIGEVPTEAVMFTSLQTLGVKIVPSAKNLLQFVMRNSSIENLSVNVVNQAQITPSFIEELKQLEHLKHLSFLGNGEAMKSIFELTKKGDPPKGFKVLQLHILPEASTSWKVMKFYFPITSTTKFVI